MDTVEQIDLKLKQLDYSIKELKKNGTAFAEAERDYKIAVNKKALELKSEGMPVTLIQTVIYGYADIAAYRFKRDSNEVIYNANMEAINSLKLQLRLLDNQYTKEYGNTKNE